MKRIIYLTLSITAGLALFRPFSASAADDDKNKKPGPKGAVHTAPVVHTAAPVTHATTFKPQVVQHQTINKNVNVNKNVVRNRPVVAPAAGGPPAGGGGKFTRSNNYGGRWTAGNNHPDWNRGQVNNWNGHQYRWYDGGWLIVDGGFWPVPGYYAGGGSLMAGAQQQLANQGYYNGPIDGVPGPGTRQAIANFQSNNGLDPTGHLNPPTQQALGLQ